MIVNRQQLADILGVTLPTVDARVAKGLPYKTKGKGGKSYEFETKDVINWMLGQAKENVSSDGSITSYNEARRRKMNAEADLTELELAQKAALVVLIEDANKAIVDAATMIRTQLLGLPRRAAPELLGETDEEVVKAILDEHIREVLGDLSNALEEEAEAIS